MTKYINGVEELDPGGVAVGVLSAGSAVTIGRGFDNVLNEFGNRYASKGEIDKDNGNIWRSCIAISLKNKPKPNESLAW